MASALTEAYSDLPAQTVLPSADSARWRQLYEAVLANTPDLGYVFDLEHRFTYANDALLKMWGRTWEDAIGKTCLELGYEPWHAAMHDREIEQVIATRKSVRGEVPFNGTEGRRIYDYIFFPVIGDDGKVEAVAGSTRDVTERKRAQVLSDCQRRTLQSLAEGAPLREILGNLLEMVERHCGDAMLGSMLLLDETGTRFQRGIGPNLPDAFNAAAEGVEVASGIGACCFAVMRREPVAVPDFAADPMWERFAALVEPFGLRSAWCNPILGADGKALGSFANYYRTPGDPTPQDRELVEVVTRTAAAAIERKHSEEARFQAEDLLREQTQTLRDNEQRLAQDLSDTLLLQSISAEISREENSNALYEKVLAAAVALMRSDFGSMQMYYPERGKGGELHLIAHHGFDPEATRVWEWVGVETPSSCGAVLRSGRRAVVPDLDECSWIAGTAGLREYQKAGIRAAQSTPLLSRSGKLLGMISTHWKDAHQPSERDFRMLDIVARQAADLIERRQVEDRQKKSEDALRRSEKFAVAGRMAAAIAHEINNPLEAVVNLCYLLGQENLSPEGRERLKTMGEELNRVSHITKQTLEFYRDGNAARAVNLAASIEAAVTLFSRKAEQRGATIETAFRCGDGIATVYGFAGELRQLFANLIGNALEAGATRIRIRVSADPDGKMARVLVADNGAGIGEDAASKVFEPFFTTKAEKGTGLGLWVSRGIVQKHEGRIGLRTCTEPGRSGTIFRMSLPLMAKPASREESTTAER